MSNEIDDSGPAFPKLTALWNDNRNSGGNNFKAETVGGMSLRDYFAAAALQGIISAVPYEESVGFDRAAGWAYDYADAMLKARKEKP